MSFEGDDAGKRFASLLMGRHDLERTLVIDRYSRFHISDQFLPSPKNILKASLWQERRETLRVARDVVRGRRDGCTGRTRSGILFLEFVSRNHKKSVVIDDRIVYLGGINVCDHNFAWRDIMLRIDDERVGAFMRDDIAATLRGENLSSRRDFGDLEIALLDGRVEPAAERARPAADPRSPRRRSSCRAPTSTYPFFDYLAEAVQPRRGGHARHAEAQQQAQDDGVREVGRRPGRRHGAALRRPHEPHQGDAGGR